MKSGGDILPYNLYRTRGGTQVWGDGTADYVHVNDPLRNVVFLEPKY